jgi:hypothetical protein
MTHRIDTLIQHATAFALAAVMTLATIGAIDGLASRERADSALLAQAPNATAPA